MADFNSPLPVRTENNGDIVAKLGDGTTPSQFLAIDASGRIVIKLDDGAGNLITSQASGAQRALDVGINVAGVQVDPRAIRALTVADAVTATTNADGSLSGGAAGSKSLAVGGVFNTTPPTLTNGQQAALQFDVNGNLKTTSGGIVTVIGGKTPSDAFANPADALDTMSFSMGFNGTTWDRLRSSVANGLVVDVSRIVAALPTGTNVIGKAGIQVAGADVSATNPVPVTLTAAVSGTPVQAYNTAAALAAAASSNHDYTVTAAKTLSLTKIWASASGKLKIEVQVETAAASNIFNSVFVGFNSVATPNIDITVATPKQVAAGVRVRIIRTNLDKQAEDVYSTVEGSES